MSPSAQVHSLELLRRFHAVLARFGLDAQTALVSAEAELRRTLEALDERLAHWQRQVIRRQEAVSEARSSLSHARALHDGKSVGCIEQELALRKAQERLKEAEGKVATVRRWQLSLPEMIKEYDGPARGLSGFLDADLRQGLAVLQGRIGALEAYIALTAPDTGPAPPPPTEHQEAP
jgi:hypothetical protein